MSDREDEQPREAEENLKKESSAEEERPDSEGMPEQGTEQADTKTEKKGEEEVDEEELRRIVEESLDKVTVTDILLSMMNQLASVAYLKMGMPEDVNLKYRDLNQASLAIDSLEAMIKSTEGKVADEGVKPFRGTLANLQMNFVQLKQQEKGKDSGA